MPARVKAGDLPKACIALKASMDALGDNDKEIAIGEAPHELRNKAFAGMRSHLKSNNPEKFAEYMLMKNEMDRRAWLGRFLIDPESGGAKITGSNSSYAKTDTTNLFTEVWLTESQLASPLWLNSVEDSATHCKGAKDRPHEESLSLREAGIKQYQYFYKKKETSDSKGSEAKVHVEVDLKPDEYTDVKEKIDNSVPSDPQSVPLASFQEVDDGPKKKK